jgi:hypothetical protein
MHPIYRHVALDDGDKFMGDHPQRRLTHDLPRTIVFRQRVVEGDFFVAKTRLFSARSCASDVLGKPDQFFQNLCSVMAFAW